MYLKLVDVKADKCIGFDIQSNVKKSKFQIENEDTKIYL